MDFDAIVVGSGFGGAVMAYRLAREGHSVCVLERGKPYPPGSFPRSPRAMATNFWDPSEGLYGMYNVWSFSRLDAIVSSGLGGGSLIYANVLLRKDPRWFVKEDPRRGGYEFWPVTYEDLEEHYLEVERIMNVQPYPLGKRHYQKTPKADAFKEAAERLGLDWWLPNLAVTFANKDVAPVPGEQIRGDRNLHDLPRLTCELVAECDIGCNFGSKNSLDFTYLTQAAHAGADIRTRHEVRSFLPIHNGFEVRFVEHAEEAEGERINTRRLPERTLSARRLILAAGALGTPYLLFKSQAGFPHLSPMLGSKFCGNGDFLGVVLNARKQNGGEGRPHILDPSAGPVITGTIRVPDMLDNPAADGRGFYIQDAGLPQFVNWLIDNNSLTLAARLLRFLGHRGWSRLTKSPKSDVGRQVAKIFSKGLRTATSMPLLGMGREPPTGKLSVGRGGYLDLDYQPSRKYFKRVNDTMRQIAHAMGGTYASDPLWWLNLLITVHPLGGAPMGRNEQEGIVNSFGEVFNYPGLYIADGSVMPGPVGPNPSLTIAALSNRFADGILDSRGS